MLKVWKCSNILQASKGFRWWWEITRHLPQIVGRHEVIGLVKQLRFLQEICLQKECPSMWLNIWRIHMYIYIYMHTYMHIWYLYSDISEVYWEYNQNQIGCTRIYVGMNSDQNGHPPNCYLGVITLQERSIHPRCSSKWLTVKNSNITSHIQA